MTNVRGIQVTGGSFPAQMFANYMSFATRNAPNTGFPLPQNCQATKTGFFPQGNNFLQQNGGNTQTSIDNNALQQLGRLARAGRNGKVQLPPTTAATVITPTPLETLPPVPAAAGGLP